MLQDLLDEDLQPSDYSWHQMRRLCEIYNFTTGGTKEDMAKGLHEARDEDITSLALPAEEEKSQRLSAQKQVEKSDEDEQALLQDRGTLLETSMINWILKTPPKQPCCRPTYPSITCSTLGRQ